MIQEKEFSKEDSGDSGVRKLAYDIGCIAAKLYAEGRLPPIPQEASAFVLSNTDAAPDIVLPGESEDGR